MAQYPKPIRETDAGARALAQTLMQDARVAALAFVDPDTGAPFLSRIGFGLATDGSAMSLVSDLALHVRALRLDPRAGLLIGEPGPRGDPLNSPRLSLAVTAQFLPANTPDRPALRQAWLAHHPKAKLYIDFADFSFVRFEILGAMLNGGFARAYRLTADDLSQQDCTPRQADS